MSYPRRGLRNAQQDDTAWAVGHRPAVSVQATITKAAPGVGQRLVITGIAAIASTNTTAPTATALAATLSDGTTEYWGHSIVVPATLGITNGIAQTGLWIPMPENTAATLAFSAALTNCFESVSLQGVVEEIHPRP